MKKITSQLSFVNDELVAVIDGQIAQIYELKQLQESLTKILGRLDHRR